MPDLRTITDFSDLLAYLADELDWPVADYGLDDLTFEYDADELGLKDEEAEKLKDGTIRQLRPLPGGQPFGIFFVEFGAAKLPVVVLRRILNALVIKKRNSANPADRQRWDAADLLFISAFGESDDREIAFAHFHKDHDTTELPVLRVLGWDGADTPLKLAHVAGVLKNRLTWPDDPGDHDAWRKQWRGAFRHRLGHVIKTAAELADALAGFARKIRDAATTIMAHESEAKGQLRKLHRAFQSALISDLKEEDFADTYAQTVTYGLLTAAISRTEMTGGRLGTALTQDDITAMVPVTNPFLKEMLQEFLKVGGRNGGVDFDELGINEVVELLRGDETDLPAILRDFGNRKPGEDPVIHFYENFLAAYNKKLRIDRGVFYTPQPVVSYIVRSVHELLQTEFGLEDGLASTITWGEMLKTHPNLKLPPLTDESDCEETISPDEPFVQILDPATGTATFLVEVIDVIHRDLKEQWKTNRDALPSFSSFIPQPSSFEAFWNVYVPKCLLPRLHGYELMMAPYAIAHMKIGLKLAETGYKFATEERARIYLTNALESWVREPKLPDFDALAHESEAVNKIKRHKRFTVVIGNPPYSSESGNLSVIARQMVDEYRTFKGERIRERGALQFEKNIQEDYVKFWKLLQDICLSSDVFIGCLITSHIFIDNPTLRGMREKLMESVCRITVLDLHGNSNRQERPPEGVTDKNVFDIKQGVAITQVVRFPTPQSGRKNYWAEVWGDAAFKLGLLASASMGSTKFAKVDVPPADLSFVPRDLDLESEFDHGVPVDQIFNLSSTGIATARDYLAVHFSNSDLEQIVYDFRELNENMLRSKYLIPKDTNDWRLPLAIRDVRAVSGRRSESRNYQYRPFDWRYTYYTGQPRGFLCNPRWPVMRNMVEDNIGLCISKGVETGHCYSHAIAFSGLVDHHAVSIKEVNYAFPLMVIPENGSGEAGDEDQGALHFAEQSSTPVANFTHSFRALVTKATGVDPEESPRSVFAYIYAVLHSPGYRTRYAEVLRKKFAAIPLPKVKSLFFSLAKLGSELTALHLLESPKLDEPITEYIGDNHQVTKVGWTPDDGGTVWLDGKGAKGKYQPGTSGFRPVPEAVWNFHIGGYQVCEKWLKDRGPKKGKPGRTLTAEDIAHYHKIVIALTETIRLMAEIDEVIDAHGGWPGAFQSAAKQVKS